MIFPLLQYHYCDHILKITSMKWEVIGSNERIAEMVLSTNEKLLSTHLNESAQGRKKKSSLGIVTLV